MTEVLNDAQRSESVVIDADVHNAVTSVSDLLPYLSTYWREEIQNTAFKGPQREVYPRRWQTSARPGARPESGPPGSDLELTRQQVLVDPGVDLAILNCAYAVDSIHNPDAAEALAAAVNDWQIVEWLEKEPRFRASIVVPSQNAELAAKEIARVGSHPGFVQVFLPTRSAALYGQRHYYPLFNAAVEQDLVVSLQYGGFPGNPPTSVGWPSYHVEEYVGMATVMQSQMMSLLVEGVFEKFPTLRMVFVDSGFTWLPAFLWRLDKDWKGLRREVPWVRRPPSEYVREHIRFTIAPVDSPADREDLIEEVLGQMWGEELLIYASDYPNWSYEAHQQTLMRSMGPDAKRKVMGANAAAFYRLS